jgi:hypothetical protein
MLRFLVLLVPFAGCGGFNDTSGDGGETNGFGTPTLEVTVNGIHSGPAAPDGSSFVDLINQYDSSGTLTRSSLQIVATSTSANASCSMSVDRFGDFVSTFGVGQYSLSGSGLSGTGDGEAVPQGSPAASTSLGVFSCTGSACDGVGLGLSWLDASHAEGFFSGNLSGADVVCAFFLPVRTFRP